MHGDWGIEEDIYLATLRLGTDILWHEMVRDFDRRFGYATAKDMESRYNKNLKPGKNVHLDQKGVSDVIDDYRHYGPKPSPSPFEAEVIAKALSILAEYPNRRLW
ncbi:hypothetical protein PABG_07481 [Paracoccidioides brasiliensis Pb03]|uniref:Uncharacterized protein n=1 Tax=Paracoccidioides brasiliensis (strain Pb18) TaxID=502780 RepID=C1GM94_PARBD|nr:uncharacterized protein PADG_08180 [Paracoccidioides brasiliensis Pb18]EEH17320.1 hypothetical protein PABG_07481 [Paracoccidioides brasiliensis Pb03]EEH43560.1 hypothetical protein PADG_08180 [Paracoccidioides brasiliensis Pb18]ODH48548.1 hypothetical protein GX48_05311 [Paracoccidioides brasiliensis]